MKEKVKPKDRENKSLILLLRGKDMTTLDSIFKSRNITLPTKVQWSHMDMRVGL